MQKGFILKRIVRVEKRTPDDKHDTRHLECGHSVVMPLAALHPMRSMCRQCQG